jgi:Bacterial extracellular solute-binding protein, family 7
MQPFPNNQLGGDSDMFSQLRSGALECFSLSGVNVLSTLIPSASIWGIGFAFPNYQALWSAVRDCVRRLAPCRPDERLESGSTTCCSRRENRSDVVQLTDRAPQPCLDFR